MTIRRRKRICVQGVVQGVGFRPFVYTAAAANGLSGSVRNDSSGAIIEVEGDEQAIAAFLSLLVRRPPPLAVIEGIDDQDIPVVGGTGFEIADTSRSGGGRTLASPDVAMCADCAAELCDPADRRYRHAFVNCTNCGPRFTIIASLPYDRAATTMARFPMCADCAREYADPGNRRFHAQPVCCRNCGPALRFRSHDGLTADAEDGLHRARRLLRDGGILAVKGIGGYHLACDAGNGAAVAELRLRKQRGDKPFAVMVPDLEGAREVGEVDDATARVLTGQQRPIVLLPRRPGAPVADAVAPHNPDLGVMLAYTPLHALLFSAARRPGRRLADARPGDPGAVRRLRGPRTHLRRTRESGHLGRTADPAVPWLRPATGRLAGQRAADPRGRRRPEEHAGRRRGEVRVVEPAHRRHGRPRHALGIRLSPASSACTHRRRSGSRRR
jgi:hydrogenase maturation protein HypF